MRKPGPIAAGSVVRWENAAAPPGRFRVISVRGGMARMVREHQLRGTRTGAWMVPVAELRRWMQ